MKVVGLISGGKDSIYNLMQCVKYGHEICALANLKPPVTGEDELDSFCFQTVGHSVIEQMAVAMKLPLFRHDLQRKSVIVEMDYVQSEDDEVEDLFALLNSVKQSMPEIEAVSVGAILSNYQRIRVEHVCKRLGLVPLAYLWQQDQSSLFDQMLADGLVAVLVKVASMGLFPEKHLGKTLNQVSPVLRKLEAMYGMSVCGEGGEYETLTVDCPLFHSALEMEDVEIVNTSLDPYAPIGYLKIPSCSLVSKEVPSTGLPPTLFPEEENNKTSSVIYTGSTTNNTANLAADAGVDTTLSHSLEPRISSQHQGSYSAYAAEIDVPLCNADEGSNSMGPATPSLAAETAAVAAMKQLMTTLTATIRKDLNADFSQAYWVELGVCSMSLFRPLNAVYCQFMPASSPPPRACVQTSDTLLSLNILFFNPTTQMPPTPAPALRSTLHVMSISAWAPANIGPYSQASMLGDRVWVSGQIGLFPQTMQLVPPTSQPTQIASNIQNVLSCCNSSLSLALIARVFYSSSSAFESATSEVEAVFLKKMKTSSAPPTTPPLQLPSGQLLGGCEEEEEEEEEEAVVARSLPILFLHVGAGALPAAADTEALVQALQQPRALSSFTYHHLSSLSQAGFDLLLSDCGDHYGRMFFAHTPTSEEFVRLFGAVVEKTGSRRPLTAHVYSTDIAAARPLCHSLTTQEPPLVVAYIPTPFIRLTACAPLGHSSPLSLPSLTLAVELTWAPPPLPCAPANGSDEEE